MTHNEIKFALMQMGIRQSDLAKEIGVTPAAVHNVIHGRSRSDKIASHLARRIGVPIEEITGNTNAAAAA
jgi:plasmid maintenance system antidote protein VapI